MQVKHSYEAYKNLQQELVRDHYSTLNKSQLALVDVSINLFIYLLIMHLINRLLDTCVLQGMREDPAFGFVDHTGAGGWDGAAATLGGGAPDMYAFRVVPSQPNLHGMAYGSHDLRLG
jgi:hypothetical protein